MQGVRVKHGVSFPRRFVVNDNVHLNERSSCHLGALFCVVRCDYGCFPARAAKDKKLQMVTGVTDLCRFIVYGCLKKKSTNDTKILNHSQGWDGKPKGLTETAGSPKYPQIFGPGFFASAHFFRTRRLHECYKNMRGITDLFDAVIPGGMR